MKFCYREEGNEITILRCFGQADVVEIPEEIHGKPVTKLAPYAFSDRKKKEEEGKFYAVGLEEEKEPMICGNGLREVLIPKTVVELGNYLFYGCANLEMLYVTQGILRTGRGIFTGCKPKKIEMKYMQGTKSALKEILGDIRFCLNVTLWIEEEEVQLIFPEYYEEAVENTPARMIETYFNGTGYKYRQSVFQRGIDFEAYDVLFPEAIALEKEEIVVTLAMKRLLYPYELEEEFKKIYITYLKGHREKLFEIMLGHNEIAEFRRLSQINFWDVDTMDIAISEASKEGKREILSFLMNEKNQRFGQKKKTFDL